MATTDLAGNPLASFSSEPVTNNSTAILTKDLAGNPLASFTGFAVTNNSTVDVVDPTLVSAKFVNEGTQIELRISEAVTGTAGFSVDAGSISYISGSGTNTYLFSIASGAPTTISYDQGTGNVQDAAGNELVAFSGRTITSITSGAVARPLVRAISRGISRPVGNLN